MSSDDESGTPKRNETWGQRHGLTVMVVVMAVLFAVVILVQVMS